MTPGDPLVEYREALLNRLEAQPAAFAALITQLPEPEWRARPGIDGLTLHQLAVHVRDAEAQAFYPRIERILAEDEPHLEPFRITTRRLNKAIAPMSRSTTSSPGSRPRTPRCLPGCAPCRSATGRASVFIRPLGRARCCGWPNASMGTPPRTCRTCVA